MQDSRRILIQGRAIALPGNDIDTDRIIPARYLRTVVFEGLEQHVFEDDRVELGRTGQVHPFDQPERQGAKILLVGQNFGCGSSREHAPQALLRWGIRAVLGASFAEIFRANALALGMPCCELEPSVLEALMRRVEADPSLVVELDLERLVVRAAGEVHPCRLPEGARQQLVTGSWDTTGELLEARDLIRQKARELPYLNNFA